MNRFFKVIIMLVIVGIMLALAIAVAGFVYHQNATKLPLELGQSPLPSLSPTPIQNQPQSQTPINSPKAPVTVSPKQVYIAMQTELDAAANFDGIVAVVNKYASVNFKAQINNQVAGANTFQKMAYVVVVRNLFPAIVTINTNAINEKITGDTAVLIVITKDSKKTGTINLVKENGNWKIDSMNFVNQ